MLAGKKLLILGATSETCKIVKLAEDMGVETYVVDPYENALAKQYSSHPILLDCFDVDAICKLLEKEKIDGVLPGCADILVAVYEQICSRTNKFCYVNKKLVDVFNNKKGLKEMLLKHGLSVIKEYTEEEVLDTNFDKFPVFVKPVDNNSSKGMSIANSREEFLASYENAKSFSRSNTVLIEEYKQCDDFFIGYFAQNGKIRVAFTGDRFVINQDSFGSITAGIVYPSVYEQLYFKNVHEKMMDIFNELGFQNGICAIQGFVEDDKIMFYDPALRITGGQEYVLCKHFYGVDELESLINFALTGNMSEDDVYRNCDCSFGSKVGCNLTFSVRECTIGKIEGLEFAKECKNVINITQEHKEGDVIDRIGTAQQNFVRMHISAESREEMRDVISELQRKIVAYDDKGENAMIKGLDPIEWYNRK